MFTINIALVVIGILIPIGMVIFWSRAKKILGNRFESKSHCGIIINGNIAYKLLKWLYYHRSKFSIIMTVLVTMIEFLALIPF